MRESTSAALLVISLALATRGAWAAPYVSGTATLTVYSASSAHDNTMSNLGLLWLTGVSADGSTPYGGNWASGAFGFDAARSIYFLGNAPHQAVTIADGKFRGLSTPADFDTTVVFGASNSGAIAVGAAGRTNESHQAVYWDSGGIHEILPPTVLSMATNVSRDGSIILGQVHLGEYEGFGGFRYQNGVVTDLPIRPRDISADTSLIVGEAALPPVSGFPNGAYERPVALNQGAFEELPGRDGFTQGTAYAVSADGSTIVGEVNRHINAADSGFSRRAVAWNRTGAGWDYTELDLSALGGDSSEALDVSADGTRIVGHMQGFITRGFITLDGQTAIPFNTFVESFGIPIPQLPWGQAPLIPTGISDDGNVIVGRIIDTYPTGDGPASLAWMLRIHPVPEPSSFVLAAIGSFGMGTICVRRRRMTGKSRCLPVSQSRARPLGAISELGNHLRFDWRRGLQRPVHERLGSAPHIAQSTV